MTVLLLTGYRTTGKDHFYRCLTGQVNGEYYIYSNFDTTDIFSISDYQRVAAADPLKEECRQLFGISEESTAKDQLLTPEQQQQIEKIIDKKLFTLRDLYSYWGKQQVKKNKFYWCQRTRYTDYTSRGIPVVVTDWRFPHEYDFYQQFRGNSPLYTMRIFDATVTVPEQVNEHLLDDIKTDILILKRPNDCDTSEYSHHRPITFHWNIMGPPGP